MHRINIRNVENEPFGRINAKWNINATRVHLVNSKTHSAAFFNSFIYFPHPSLSRATNSTEIDNHHQNLQRNCIPFRLLTIKWFHSLCLHAQNTQTHKRTQTDFILENKCHIKSNGKTSYLKHHARSKSDQIIFGLFSGVSKSILCGANSSQSTHILILNRAWRSKMTVCVSVSMQRVCVRASYVHCLHELVQRFRQIVWWWNIWTVRLLFGGWHIFWLSCSARCND